MTRMRDRLLGVLMGVAVLALWLAWVALSLSAMRP